MLLTVSYYYSCMLYTLNRCTHARLRDEKVKLTTFFSCFIVALFLRFIYSIFLGDYFNLVCQFGLRRGLNIFFSFIMQMLVIIPMLLLHRSSFEKKSGIKQQLLDSTIDDKQEYSSSESGFDTTNDQNTTFDKSATYTRPSFKTMDKTRESKPLPQNLNISDLTVQNEQPLYESKHRSVEINCMFSEFIELNKVAQSESVDLTALRLISAPLN